MPSAVWREVYRRFEPERPAAPAWRADRPESPIPRLQRSLDADLGERQIYFMGSVGTGKSTELLRLAEARQSKDFVVFLDLVQHFESVVGDGPALYRVSAWELCFLAAVAIWRAAEDQLDHRWDKSFGDELMSAWVRVAEATGEPTKSPGIVVDLAALAKAMVVQVSASLGGPVGAGLSLLAGATSGPRWRLPMGVTKGALPDQDPAMQGLLGAVNEIITTVQSRYRSLLLVIDGLDRITDPARIRALFVDSGLFSRLACTLVICGPNLRADLNASLIRNFEIKVLPNEPVLNHDDPTKPGPGIAFFRHVFETRVRDLKGATIPLERLDRLAYYSGGQVRMFVKLIRALAKELVSEGADAVEERHVDAAVDEQRRLLEMGLHRGHIALLERVMDDPDHRLPDDDAVWSLLAGLQLAPYPNESEWYYPHPLLMRSLLRNRRPGSSA